MNKSIVTLLHNPRCSKSRQALALLREHGYHPRIIDYLKEPPGEDELRTLLVHLNMKPAQLLRRKESLYRELGLDKADYDDDRLIQIMRAHPILIERPIVDYRGKAVIGRPPDTILSLFD